MAKECGIKGKCNNAKVIWASVLAGISILPYTSFIPLMTYFMSNMF
jgi:hypothetical protein